MPVKEPAVRGAVVARMNFLLRVGAKSVELDTSQTHAASAGRVGQVQVLDWIGNRGGHDVLVEFARCHRFGRIGPNTERGKPIGGLAGRIGRAKKYRPRANVLIGVQHAPPGELGIQRRGDLDVVLVLIGIEQNRKPDLLEIAQAESLLRLGLRAAQRGQQHARQNGDDSDDNQQLNERESERAR